MNEIEVVFFGAFKAYLKAPKLCVEIPKAATIADLRVRLKEILRGISEQFDSSLLDASAFGTDDKILVDADIVEGLSVVSVLPPVCGG